MVHSFFFGSPSELPRGSFVRADMLKYTQTPGTMLAFAANIFGGSKYKKPKASTATARMAAPTGMVPSQFM